MWGRDKRILIPALICYTASVGSYKMSLMTARMLTDASSTQGLELVPFKVSPVRSQEKPFSSMNSRIGLSRSLLSHFVRTLSVLVSADFPG